MKVSFDFDGTLDRKDVQEYAKDLVSRGFEVWVCTARLDDDNAHKPNWNYDLYEVTMDVKIPYSQLKFMNYADKSEFFKGSDFIWHLDDSFVELKDINTNSKTKGISCFGNPNWKNKCERIIKKKIKQSE